MSTPFKSLAPPQVRELISGFGADLGHWDLSSGVTDEQFNTIQEMVTKYGVVVIRKTGLQDETHIALGRRFGELDDMTPYTNAGRKHRLNHVELFDVSNLDHDGSIVDPRAPRAQANRGNNYFHVDSSFNPRRAGYSLLLAHALPPPGTGGSTEFANTRAAWDDLPEEMQKELLEADYVAAHSILHSKKLAAPEHFADIEPADYPMGRHKLVQKHERSGKMNLYIAMHIHHIEGLSPEKSQALFDELFAHSTQAKYRTMVNWHDVGDLVIWDNTCLMHRAVPGEFATKHARDMRRVTVHDDSSQGWGLNEHSDVRQGLP